MCVDRGGLWKGDILFADIEELENLDASEIHARMLNAKEATKGCKYEIPNRSWYSKIFGKRL